MKKGAGIALIAGASLVLAVLLSVGGCLVFLLDANEADREAMESFSAESDVSVKKEGRYTVFESEGSKKAFVFYPGARVESEAYEPLMRAVCERGITCVLVDMPLYFPLIDPNAAEGARELCPEIEEWYIGGHSLGGYSASMHLSESIDEYEGFVLLASYPAKDISKSNLSVLCIYGSEDTVLNMENHKNGHDLLPASFREVVIEGGCHAFFGMYTGQDEDMAKGITNEEQIALTADEIARMVYEESN